MQEIKQATSSPETSPSDSATGARPTQENDPLVKEPVHGLESKATVVEAVPTLKYFGKNLKKVLILFANNDEEKLPAQQEIFLGKIIHAVGLNFDDIALVNAADLSEALMEQLNHFDARIQISFGVKNQALHFKPSLVPYKIYKDAAKAIFLADDLEVIETEQEKKVKLWTNLKTLFLKS